MKKVIFPHDSIKSLRVLSAPWIAGPGELLDNWFNSLRTVMSGTSKTGSSVYVLISNYVCFLCVYFSRECK